MNIYSGENKDLIKKTKSKFVGKLKVEVCPKCESIFITSKECEACGFQFSIDRIGEPFGEKSFYALKDTFLASFPSIVRAFPKLEIFFKNRNKKYVFELKRRFQLLAEYFANDPRPGSEFALEVRELVVELSEYNVPENYFLNERWNHIPLWFQMAISEGLNHYLWQKKSRVMARDFKGIYSKIKSIRSFPIAKWIVIYGLCVAFALYVARISYSS